MRLGSLGLLRGNETVLHHAVNDVELARARPLRVADRVVGRRRLGQASQHGGFGDGDVLERLAKIGFRGSSKTVGAVAQENLVHVDFQYLVLAEHVLQLEGQQNFVDLAGERLFRGQVDIARHLHRDGGGPLAFGLAHVRQAGADHAHVVHPAVLVKAGIFNSQHGVGHDLGDFADGSQVAPFLAKLTQQISFGGEHPQRQLGVVIG